MFEPDAVAGLRDRLLALHADAPHQLAAAETIDPGLMRLVADANACLRVLDNAEARRP